MPAQPSSNTPRNQSWGHGNDETPRSYNTGNVFPGVSSPTKAGIQPSNHPNQPGLLIAPSSLEYFWPLLDRIAARSTSSANPACTPGGRHSSKALAPLAFSGSDPFSSPLDPLLNSLPRIPPPYLPRTDHHQAHLPTSQSQSQSGSTESSTQQSGTTRSEAKDDIQLSDIPIHYITFSTPRYILPQAAQELYNSIKSITQGNSVPPRLTDHAMHHLVDHGVERRMVERDFSCFLSGNPPSGLFEGLTSADNVLLWNAVKNLYKAAIDYCNNGVSESE